MKTLVIAPHPDDEVLGCGGTLLRRKSEGGLTGWLIVTGISEQSGWSEMQVNQREVEIAKVNKMIGFDQIYNLRLPTMQLDKLPKKELIDKFSGIFNEFRPQEILLPHCSDVHTDHKIVFDVTASCVKWFRHPYVVRVLAYETLSETEFGLNVETAFRPNYFIDISNYLEPKIDLMKIYRTELGDFPFPRSIEAIKALAVLRGSNAGFGAAEGFQLLLERE